jgi:hypothetical protein
MRVNDDQAEKSARRMSVYPIKGGLGDRAAPTTPFKSPFKSGAHLREFTSATPGAAQTLSPSRLGDLYQNCIKLSNENVSLYHKTDCNLSSLIIFPIVTLLAAENQPKKRLRVVIAGSSQSNRSSRW